MVPRYLIALVGAAVVGIGLYLFLSVNADPLPVTKAEPVATRPIPGSVPAQHVQPFADGSGAVRPVLPVAPTNPTIGAVPSGKDDDEVTADKAQATAALRARFRAPPSFKMRPNPKIERFVKEAQDAYDKGDLAKAKAVAAKVLGRSPGNPQMLHVLVAANCAEGNAVQAQKYYGQLAPAARPAMKKQCSVPLTDPTP